MWKQLTTNVRLHVENKHVGSAVFTVEYVSFIAQTESLCGITRIENMEKRENDNVLNFKNFQLNVLKELLYDKL